MTRTTPNADSSTFRDDAGVEYAAFIEIELNDQRAAKESCEQRGLAVVSTSGALITALFGIIALLTERNDFRIPDAATIPLYISLALFVIATLGGLLVNQPIKVRGLVPDGPADGAIGLDQIICDGWANTPAVARRRVALTRAVILGTYQSKNAVKARILIFAILAEAVAVLALAAAVALILRDST